MDNTAKASTGERMRDEAARRLRDEFAMAALAGGLEQGVEDDMQLTWWHDPHKIAKRAYAIADAMLSERAKI